MAEENSIATLEWSGEKINISKDGKFYVPLLEKSYSTMDDARSAIGRKLSSLEKVAKKKIELACVNGKGTPLTITGIHAGRGKKLTSPKIDRYGPESDFYPAHANIRRLLEKKESLLDKINAINNELRNVELEDDPYNADRIAVDERYKQVEEDYAKKLAACDSLDMTVCE